MEKIAETKKNKVKPVSTIHQRAIAKMQKEFFSPDDLAEKLHITPHAVRKLIREGKIKAIHAGRKWLISRKENLMTYGKEEFKPY